MITRTLTICPKPHGFEVRAGDGPDAHNGPYLAFFIERENAELFLRAWLNQPAPSSAAETFPMIEEQLDPAELAGWAAFEAGSSLHAATIPAEPWRRGWWLAHGRRYAEGYLAAAVFGTSDDRDDDTNPHGEEGPAGEAWRLGFDDRSHAEARKIAPSYLGGR